MIFNTRERALLRRARLRRLEKLDQILSDVATRDYRAPNARGTIIFFHGLHESAELYNLFLDSALREGFNIFAYDMHNHGLSISDEEKRGLVYSFEDSLLTARAAVEWVIHSRPLENKPIILVGHSFGALIAIRLLQKQTFFHKHGNRIAGIVGINTIFKVDHNVSLPWQLLRGAIIPLIRLGVAHSWTRDLLSHIPVGRNNKKVEQMREWAQAHIETLETETEGRGGIPLEQGDADLSSGSRSIMLLTAYEINEAVDRANEQIKKIRVPILFPHGLNDFEAPVGAVNDAIRRLGSGTAVYYPCGHMLLQEIPDARYDILAWIKKCTDEHQKTAN